MFAERVLRDAGYDVVVASDGLEALSIVDEQGIAGSDLTDDLRTYARASALGLGMSTPDTLVRQYYDCFNKRRFAEAARRFTTNAVLEHLPI